MERCPCLTPQVPWREAGSEAGAQVGWEGAAAALELEGSDFRTDNGIILVFSSRRNTALGTHSSLQSPQHK